MKYSDYVKNEMNTLSEDVVMEAAGMKANESLKSKKSRSESVVVRGTRFDSIKDFASVAACAVLVVAAALALILLPGSLPTQDTTPADSGSSENDAVEWVEVPVWERSQMPHEADLAVDILTSTDGNYNYYVIDGKATVVRYLGNAEKLTVPNIVDGYEVVKIEGYFLDENLIDRTDTANDNTDKNFGFIFGTGVSEVTIPGTVEVGHMAFTNCEYLMRAKFGEGLETFEGGYTFYNCPSLRSIEIPKSLNEWGLQNYSHCITFGHIYYLGTEAEWHRIDMDPDNFAGMEITVVYGTPTPENYVSKDGNFEYYVENDTAVINRYLGDEKKLTVPEMVDDYYVARIEGFPVTVEEGYLNLGGNRQFGIIYGTDVTEVVVPGTVKIGEDAFATCHNLRKITFENGVKEIGLTAVSYCINLKEVNLPDTLLYIGIAAFKGNEALTKIAIPDSVTEIGGSAFSFCASLAEVKLSENLGSIADYTFSNCESLQTITIPDSVTTIGQGAFSNCYALRVVNIGLGVETIGEAAFFRCTSLGGIIIPENVKLIKEKAFCDCTALINVTLLSEDAMIEFYAFKNSPVENSYNAPQKPRNIAEVEIDFDENLISDSANFAFEGSSKIKTSEDGNYNYVIKDEGLIILKYLGDETSVVIPTEIDGIKVYGTQGYQVIDHCGYNEQGNLSYGGRVHGIFFESKVESVLIPTTIEVGHETFATYEPENVSYYTP